MYVVIKKVLATLLMLNIWLISCTPAPGNLEDKNWVLESLGKENNQVAVLAGSEITANFDSTQKKVTGSGGCNRYFGNYSINGSNLKISGVGSTKMFCQSPPGVMEQESNYLSALEAAQSYKLEGGKLKISCSGGRLLVFRAK